jgi:hypothetical protein
MGILTWGIRMGAQESVLNPWSRASSKVGPRAGYGDFETAFGAAWFVGSL